MVSVDDRHWWYRGRRLVIQSQVRRLALPPQARLLDAGCGSGRMLDELERFGSVSGIDSSSWSVAAARNRGHADVILGSVERMPYPDRWFDLVTCLDVLEHTPDDVLTLTELGRVTRPGGHLLVTVPAYQALWSAHDEANHHYRRYRRRRLLEVGNEAGWELVRASYFNSLLLLPAAVVRLARRGRGDPTHSELSFTPPWLDPVLTLPLRIESAFMRIGGRLPAGLSVLALFRRPDVAQAIPIRPDTRELDLEAALAV